MDTSVFQGIDVDNDCYFDWSDDEDIICSSKYISSDEDDDQFIATLKSTKKSKRVIRKDDKDDFEREMASELSLTMRRLTASIVKKKPECSHSEGGNSQESSDKSTSKMKDPEDTSEFYDDIYFDSDESETEVTEDMSNISRTKKKKKEKRRILTNDELFYDPTLDDQDQEWVDRKRRSYQVKKKRPSDGSGMSSVPQPLPQSDAVLNCPACLTTLCMDCQRHEVYRNQYRAMFVFNCNVDMTERLKFPTKGQKKKNFLRNKRNRDKQQLQQEDAPNTPVSSGMPPVQPDLNVTPQEDLQDNEMEVQQTAHGKNQGSPSTASTSKVVTALDTVDNVVTAPDTVDKVVTVPDTVDKVVAVPDTVDKVVTAPDTVDKVVTAPDTVDKTSPTSKGASFEGSGEDEMFHPVTCKICNTKVAVYDTDEVYHFFNIVTSY